MIDLERLDDKSLRTPLSSSNFNYIFFLQLKVFQKLPVKGSIS